MMLNGLALFAGIGGIEIGLSEWVRTVCYVENDPYAAAVIQSRIRSGQLDDAPIWDDVCTFDGAPWAGCVDIVTGGFPCQDVSLAGKRAGIDGERSGLWSEMVRIIREVRPRYIFVENVAAIVSSGMSRIQADLASCGMRTRWDCIPACAVGARHISNRMFAFATTGEMDKTNGEHKGRESGKTEKIEWWDEDDPMRPRFGWGTWAREPDLARVAYGVPVRVDRLRCLGNAVVPAQAREAFKRLTIGG